MEDDNQLVCWKAVTKHLRDGPLENLVDGEGGGRGGEFPKKYSIFAQVKIKWKKNHARQLVYVIGLHAV